MMLRNLFEEAIVVDEIGLEFARHGPALLKTGYQPVFRREADSLVVHAVIASTICHLAGHHPDLADLPDGQAEAARMFRDTLERIIHLRNTRQLDATRNRLLLPFDLAAQPAMALEDQIGLMALERDGLDVPADVFCVVSDTERFDAGLLVRCAALMQQHRIGLAIDDFGGGFPSLERLSMLSPDLIRIDGGWFRRVAAVPRACKLLRALVHCFVDHGAEVLIDGIETPAHLDAAIDSGATLLQGDLLAPVKPAGAIFPPEPLHLDALLGVLPGREDTNVVSLAVYRHR